VTTISTTPIGTSPLRGSALELVAPLPWRVFILLVADG
jgi:hypothetical protein